MIKYAKCSPKIPLKRTWHRASPPTSRHLVIHKKYIECPPCGRHWASHHVGFRHRLAGSLTEPFPQWVREGLQCCNGGGGPGMYPHQQRETGWREMQKALKGVIPGKCIWLWNIALRWLQQAITGYGRLSFLIFQNDGQICSRSAQL